MPDDVDLLETHALMLVLAFVIGTPTLQPIGGARAPWRSDSVDHAHGNDRRSVATPPRAPCPHGCRRRPPVRQPHGRILGEMMVYILDALPGDLHHQMGAGADDAVTAAVGIEHALDARLEEGIDIETRRRRGCSDQCIDQQRRDQAAAPPVFARCLVIASSCSIANASGPPPHRSRRRSPPGRHRRQRRGPCGCPTAGPAQCRETHSAVPRHPAPARRSLAMRSASTRFCGKSSESRRSRFRCPSRLYAIRLDAEGRRLFRIADWIMIGAEIDHQRQFGGILRVRCLGVGQGNHQARQAQQE